MWHHSFCFLLVTLISVLSIQAKDSAVLEFTQTTKDITAKPSDKQITISFPFENKTKETITITKHAAACACLGAKFKDDKKTYAPGEKGELSATFKLGNYYGVQSKQLLLWQEGDTPAKPSIVLTCKVTIPELFSITPKTLTWDLGAETSEQTCTLSVKDKDPIHITSTMVTNRNFEFKVETIKEGREYKLTVKPKKTDTPTFGLIRVTTDCSISRFKRGQVFAIIRRKPDTK